MSLRVTLVPRVAGSVDAALVNEWLEARDASRLEPDHLVLPLANADIASQAEVWTAPDGEPLARLVVDMATGGHTYGASLVSEVRRLCEELAEDFDLVVETSAGPREVAEHFDAE